MAKTDTLKSYVGKQHAAEIETLISKKDFDLSGLSLKSPTVALILSIAVGIIGIDRLYQGGATMFFYKISMILLTFGTWWIADFYYTKHTVEESNYQKVLSACS